MHAFQYQQDRLYCESVSLEAVAEEFGTPLYVYSAATILDHYRRLNAVLGELDHEVCFALKANSNLAVLRLLASEGSGFDLVSGGELFRVLKAGGDPSKCTFAGVGKSGEEIAYALQAGIYCFNVESEAELLAINEVAAQLKKTAPVAFRINPDVAASTHKYISTGKSEHKFGIGLDRAPALYALAAGLENVSLRGVQMHIGSQITKAEPFASAIQKVVPLVQELRQEYGISFFSIGGGIGIVYRGSLESGTETWWKEEERDAMTLDEYAGAVVPSLKPLQLRVLIEPGRFLVGNAGVLLTRVQYIKDSPGKTFVIVDAGMNDLIRPALYEGYHEVVPVRRSNARTISRVDVVGPVCETGDFFAQDRELPEVASGELLALMSAGAYGFTMASNYNSRPLPAEVLVQGAEVRLIRRRQTYEDLISLELPSAVSAAAV